MPGTGTRLSTHLNRARRQFFVGRESEKSLFSNLLDPAGKTRVFYLYAAGGFGKSSLLKEFADLASERELPVVELDCRSVMCTPTAVKEAITLIRQQSGLGEDSPQLLIIDTFELLKPLESWLRTQWLPMQSDNLRVVIAGREPPSPAWRSDAAWITTLHHHELKSLEAPEAELYLTRRGLQKPQIRQAIGFARGHPLALALIADALVHSPDQKIAPEHLDTMLSQLLASLLRDVKHANQRTALYACGVCRIMNEPLLSAVLQTSDVSSLFDWLRDLSFMQSAEDGLFPHDLVREALVADLRTRHADLHHQLGMRAYQWSMDCIEAGGGMERIQDLYFLAKDFFVQTRSLDGVDITDAEADEPVYLDICRPTDLPEVEDMILRHENETSLAQFTLLYSAQPEGLSIFRNAQQAPVGFSLQLQIDRLPPEVIAQDSIVANFWQLCRSGGGKHAHLLRFWMHRDLYMQASSVSALAMGSETFTWVSGQADFGGGYQSATPGWLAHAGRVGFSLLENSHRDFKAGPSVVVYQDFTRNSPLEWMRSVYHRAYGLAPEPSAEALRLDEGAFHNAVKQALKDYARTDRLHDNPLLQTHLVGQAADSDNPALRINALRQVITDHCVALSEATRTNGHARILERTYLKPAANQAVAAEILNLSERTYRRRLTEAIKLLATELWAAEQSMT